MRLGFVGLGNLGCHLAASLARAGFGLTVNDLEQGRAAGLLGAGAEWAPTPRAVAERSDSVITCLPSPAAVSAAVEGESGVLAGLRSGGTWLDTSTSDKALTLRLADAAAGGVHLAASGEITVIVGGDEAVFEAHRPVLEAIGRQVFHVGPLGAATDIKVITNMLAFIHLVASGEALMLARRAGLDLAQAFEVIRASSGNSFVHETEGRVILNGSYDIGFTMDLALKDLGFASRLGHDLGVPIELASLTEEIFVRARDAYGGEEWSTAVVRLLEEAVGTDLRAPGFPSQLTA
jgi:3-hydroxyisobutyrate dehydrogenase